MAQVVITTAGRPTPVWEGTTFVTQFQIHDLIGGAPLAQGDTVYGACLVGTGGSDTIATLDDPPGAGPGGFAHLTGSHALATSNCSTMQCTIAGTELTVIACRPADEVLEVGHFIFTDNGNAGYITSFGTGTGGVGTYNLSQSSTVSTPSAMWTQYGWLVPNSWKTGNVVQLWGASGNGGSGSIGLGRGGGGGGGGAWAKRTNITLTPLTYVPYQVGTFNHSNNSDGGCGSWFNGTNVDTSVADKVSARGGGTGDDTGIGNGGSGGNTGVGDVVHTGGSGGSYNGTANGGGGGGAAGPAGNGVDGADGSTTGGNGGNGADGALGGSGADSSTAPTAGADGSTSSIRGAGAGAGAGADAVHFGGAAGGNWGGGGGGVGTDGITTTTPGVGRNAGIVITWPTSRRTAVSARVGRYGGFR